MIWQCIGDRWKYSSLSIAHGLNPSNFWGWSKMKHQNSLTTALFGAILCLSLVGFSDTAFGQATTISVDNPTINLVVPAGGSGSAQIHVSTNNSTNVFINTNSAPSWLS